MTPPPPPPPPPGSAPPRRPDGFPAWFTPAHNAWLERSLQLHPGAVLDIYQAHLVPTAQRVLAENGEAAPPAYESLQGHVPSLAPVLVRGNAAVEAGALRRGDAVARAEEARADGRRSLGRPRTDEDVRLAAAVRDAILADDAGRGRRRREVGVGAVGGGGTAGRPVPAFVPAAAAGERVQRGRGVQGAAGAGSSGGVGSVSSRTRSGSG